MENRSNIEQSFRNFLNQIGHPLDGSIQFDTDGWPRYACPHSSDKHNQDVAYKAHSDGTPALKVKCHKCHPDVRVHKYKSEKSSLKTNNYNPYLYLKTVFHNAIECDKHEYLTKKQVCITKDDGLKLRIADKALLCPIYSITNSLISCQTIKEGEPKKFFKGTSPKGGFHILGKQDDNTFILCEGISTSLTVREALNHAVVCVYGKNNFSHVALALKNKHLNTNFIFICDNDSNQGSEDAIRQAIRSLGGASCNYFIPDFSAISSDLDQNIKRSDFNDLFILLMESGKSRLDALFEIKFQLQKEIVINSHDTPIQLPDPLKPVMKFDESMLPDSIKDYVLDIANRQQCPIDFVAVTAMCGLAAALGNKALILPKQQDDWIITPNLWGVIIGRPSAMKTPSMKAALNPLHKIDSDVAKQYEIEKKHYQVEKEFAELSKSSAKEIAKMHFKNGSIDQAKSALEVYIFSENPPTCKRIIINDTTVEKLGELLNENPTGLILVRDELSGWLSKLGKEEFQTDRAFYLECFDGSGTYKYDRIGRGTIIIENTTLSIIGGIQPSKIIRLVQDAINGNQDDGLIQRLQLTVWPDDLGDWKWKDYAPNKDAQKKYADAFYSLYNLSSEIITPVHYRFTLSAQELFVSWMEENHKFAKFEDVHPAFESHLLKMPKTIATLALIFELLEGGREGVGENSIKKAIKWAEYLKSHAERLYGMAINCSLKHAHEILKKFNKLKDEFTVREISQKGWAGLTDSKIIGDALEWLVDYKHLNLCDIKPTPSGGRPTTVYRKNKKYVIKV